METPSTNEIGRTLQNRYLARGRKSGPQADNITGLPSSRPAIDVHLCLHDKFPTTHLLDIVVVEQLDEGTSRDMFH